MKIIVCLLLTLSMILGLCGCAFDGNGTQIGKTEPTQDSSVVIHENKNPLADYDPEREFYIMSGDVEVTGYGNRYDYIFYIMSKQPVSADNISVQIDCKNEYTWSANPHQIDYRATEYENGSGRMYLPFYVYQNYLGVDFTLAAQLYDWHLTPPEEGSEEAEEMEAVTQGRDPKAVFDELVNTGVEEFKTLKPEDVREFYLCSVWVTINVEKEETITQMNVTIGDQDFQEEIGTLHLVPGAFPASYSWPVGDERCWEANAIPGTYYVNALYSDGLAQVYVFDKTAVKDVTLEELRFLDAQFEVKEIILQVTSGENTVSSKWDGKTPFTVYAGDQVYIEIVVQNDIFTRLTYETVMNYELIYSMEGEKFSEYNYPVFYTNVNYHEIYAIAFDGIDMEPYYKDYYYHIYEQWRKEYE